MFSFAKSRNIVAMKDVALLYTSNPDSPCGNLFWLGLRKSEGAIGGDGGRSTELWVPTALQLNANLTQYDISQVNTTQHDTTEKKNPTQSNSTRPYPSLPYPALSNPTQDIPTHRNTTQHTIPTKSRPTQPMTPTQLNTAYVPIVKPSEARSFRLGVDDGGQVLEISELLLGQPWLLSHSDDIVSVERFDHTR